MGPAQNQCRIVLNNFTLVHTLSHLIKEFHISSQQLKHLYAYFTSLYFKDIYIYIIYIIYITIHIHILKSKCDVYLADLVPTIQTTNIYTIPLGPLRRTQNDKIPKGRVPNFWGACFGAKINPAG